MSDTTNSANMSLPLPIVGQEPGPQYGTDQNTCFTILDAHDHSAGNGVQITPSGININSSLSFNGFNAQDLVRVVFNSSLAALTGTNFLSDVNGNLYFNDGSGNQIQITSGGGVAGSPGSIGSLASPAAATYSAGSKLFTWTADSGKAAAMDNGAVTIRETNVASAKGITLLSPTALAADYNFTLPAALPASTQYLTCTSGGVTSFSSANTISAAMTATGANTIAATMTTTGTGSIVSTASAANANTLVAKVTRATGTAVGAGGVAISSSCGTQSITTSGFDNVTNLAITIITSGRPVSIFLIPDGTAAPAFIELGGFDGHVRVIRNPGATLVAEFGLGLGNGSATSIFPPGVIQCIDSQVAGTYDYIVQAGVNGAANILMNLCKLVVYEL